MTNTLNSKNRRLWSLQMSVDSGDRHEMFVTDSGVFVRIRARLLFNLVGYGLTCSRKKS